MLEHTDLTVDEDPGCPSPTELVDGGTLELARTLANYGEIEPGTTEAPAQLGFREAVFDGDFGALQTTLRISVSELTSFLQDCMEAGVSYGPRPGAKVPFHGAEPGRDFKHVDCSGFFREAIWRATSPHLNVIDGSVRQHDWVRSHGFKRTDPNDALREDHIVRAAFFRPQDSSSGIGHVALVHNASTIESHGGKGPNTRKWNLGGWQAKAFIYLLTEA